MAIQNETLFWKKVFVRKKKEERNQKASLLYAMLCSLALDIYIDISESSECIWVSWFNEFYSNYTISCGCFSEWNFPKRNSTKMANKMTAFKAL